MKQLHLAVAAATVSAITVVALAGPAAADGYRAVGVDKTIPISQASGALGVDTGTDLIYAANANYNTVTVIDGATDTQLGTPIPVGQLPMAVAVNSTTHRIYVPNRISHSISVIDGLTQKVIDTIDVGASGIFGDEVYPTGVAINEATNTLYVVNRGVKNDISPLESVFPASVLVIDAQSDTVVTKIPLSDALVIPFGIAVDTSTNQIYIAVYPGLEVIDGKTNTIEGSIETIDPAGVGTAIQFLAMNPVTQTLYAAGSWPGTVVAVSTVSNTVVARIDVGAAPREMSVNTSTNTIYVPSGDDDSVSVIDGSTNTITGAPINVGHKPSAVVVNSITRKLYVTNFGDQTLTVAHEWMSPTITTKGVPNGTNGTPYSADITATGFWAPTFSVTAGTFPPGLNFNTTTGHISGTPAKIGIFTFVVTASNAAGHDVSATYTVKIS